jgi:hypothetical protein
MPKKIIGYVLALGLFFSLAVSAQGFDSDKTTLSEFLCSNPEEVASIRLTKVPGYLEKRTSDKEKIADFFRFADSVILRQQIGEDMVIFEGYYITIMERSEELSFVFVSDNGEVDYYSPYASRSPQSLYSFEDIKKISMLSDFYAKFDSKIADDWALDDIAKAINHKILPEKLQNNYMEKITRERYCELIIGLLDTKQPQVYKNPSNLNVFFEDCQNSAVGILHINGIVSGRGAGKFDPDGFLTRQEAATILFRLMCLYGLNYDVKTTKYDKDAAYADLESVADWAKDAVNAVMNAGIMIGDGSYFLPKSPYTNQQAIITILRLYDLINTRRV